MTASAPIFQVFNYSKLEKEDLVSKGKAASNHVFGFIRQTLDNLVELGGVLQEFKGECLLLENGKQIFSDWLKSLGTSHYVAEASIKIHNWFINLSERRQQLVRERVQFWKISGLCELTKLADDLIEEAISYGKKTASQVKQFAIDAGIAVSRKSHGKKSKVTNDYVEVEEAPVDDSQVESVELGSNALVSKSKKIYSEEELEAKLALLLAQKEKELEEKKIGHFIEAEEAARKSVGAELKSYKERNVALEQQKQELLHLVDTQEQELQQLRSLQARNEQLEQRVVDFEKVRDNSNKNSSNANHQATKQPEIDFVLLLPRLMSEAHSLREVVSTQEKELAQLHAINLKQQEDIKEWRQSSESDTNIEAIVKEFGTLGESIGWNGWNRHG